MESQDKVFMRLEDQKSLTQKKAQRMLNQQTNQPTANTQEFRTFKDLRTEQVVDISDRQSLEGEDGNRRRPSRGNRPKGFEEIELPGKDRGRQSDLGLNNKYQHRRL
jgi:hypothetical protein